MAIVRKIATPGRRLRGLALAVTLLVSAGFAAVAQRKESPAVAQDPRLLPYVQPGQLIDIGHRRINLYCSGAGSPTVILMAGISSWSAVWYQTQPLIAKRSRVCGFDRAGYGFSDPAPAPEILSDTTEDLHSALKAGAIPGPYVLVGHSLGGVEARLYAQRWPKQVAGMVLVDTSPAAEGLIDEDQPGFDEITGRESNNAHLLHCALLAGQSPLEPSTAGYKECALGLPADAPAELRKIFPRFFTAYYFADRVSLMFSLYTHRYDSVDQLALGATPLVVLSTENTWNTGTPAGIRFNQSYAKVWIGMHEALARLSSRGVHRIVPGTDHEIQLERPEAVADAVSEVLQAVRSGRE